MAYYHGVKTYEKETSLLPPRTTYSALPFCLGMAPIHRLSAEAQAKVAPGQIIWISSLAEAGQLLGIDVQSDEFGKWTLSEFVYSEFSLFGVTPMVVANLFDPAKHKKDVSNEAVSFSGGIATLSNPDVIGTVTLTPPGGGSAYVEGVDYAFAPISGQISAIEGGALDFVEEVSASYSYAAPELVTKGDCIGGYDVETGKTTGISLMDMVFPKYRYPPTLGLAPKFGEDPEVAMVLQVKCSAVNGIFKAVALCDISSDTDMVDNPVKLYSDISAYKQKNNLVNRDLFLFWPKVKIGDHVMHMSVQAAGVMASTDADNGDIPFVNPSNKNFQMTAAVVDGEELWLGLEQANYLNSVGVVTALNWADGWKLWGPRTACYPDVTDPKDTFISSRRMVGFYSNHLILTYWQKVDWPMALRLVKTIVTSEQVYLNSLVAREALLGGRIAFHQSENATTELIDGKITFHVYLGIVPPAEEIDFIIEWDPDYMEALFS